MPLEKLIADTTMSTTKITEKFVRDVWSKLDAAAEKQKPSEYLSQTGIKAIQGVTDAGRSEQ